MTAYDCNRCGFNTTHKNNFRKHLLRQHPCKSILSDESISSIGLRYNIPINDTKSDSVSGLNDVIKMSSFGHHRVITMKLNQLLNPTTI